jgi:hypothetical protein
MLSSLEQDANDSINISSLFPDIKYMLLKPQHETVLQDWGCTKLKENFTFYIPVP